MTQVEAIQRVLDAINGAIGSSYVVTRHPDLENRTSRDVDAYAESSGLRPLAIEHTEILSLQDQNRDSAWFVSALGSLERELAGVFRFRLDVVVPYNNVAPGSNWERVRLLIREWLVANCSTLPEGYSKFGVPGVSFPLALWKHRSEGGDGSVLLMREVPPGDCEALLLQEMRRSLGHKYERLAEYREAGAESVLVLQSEDVALVSPQSLYEAFLRATRQQPRPALEQVWMLSVGAAYCFHGATEILERVNPSNFRFGPQYADEWLGADSRR